MRNEFRYTPAFTLVELLVVVSIIALLLAILLPSLNKARQAAQSISCLANLHQIGIGESFYAQEHSQRLTPCDRRNTAWNGPNLTWAGNLAGVGYINAPIINQATAQHTTPGSAASSLRCPSGLSDAFTDGNPASRTDANANRPYVSGIWNGSSRPTNRLVDVWYGANASSGSYNYPLWRVASDNDINNWDRYPRLDQIPRPNNTIAFFDGSSLCNWSGANGNRISARHNAGTTTNVSFWDGHTESAASNLMPTTTNLAYLRALSADFVWLLTQ